MVKKRILVVCTHNSARSQIAEAYLRHFLGDKAEVRSAGTEPRGVHPLAQAVMKEAGHDISTHTSDPIQKYLGEKWDYVITVCDHAREACPYVPAEHHVHVSFSDPSQGDIENFRQVREAIRLWAISFAESI
ncbi:MAG: arsenate reductase ArsC [Bacteroidia bacterium]|nr:arsenate reductase ArsC [Bacteroidia bacterium]MCX7652035.1 arsenate reductase ArsC [Bacteroidia bacterium]MDW8416294.1 arsenate reductase ArsC [Bacteroidia bacterium]